MSDEQRPMTDYLVLVVVDQVPEGEEGVGPETWPVELWREPAVISVVQRTARSVVLEQAKVLVAPLLSEGVPKVKIRVIALSEVTEAIVEAEMVPSLTVTIVSPGGGVEASEEGAAGAESDAGGVGQGDGAPGGLTPVAGTEGNLATSGPPNTSG
jgi:hypothetical protein